MKLKVHLFPRGDDSQELLEASIPEPAREIISARWSVLANDPALPTILRSGDSTAGFGVSVEAVFTATELRQLSHFEVVCRKYVAESKQDYEWNMAACLRAPLEDKGGESPIRLGRGFRLSRIALKPNMVGAVGDWVGEYVVGSAVAGVFESNKFSGVSFLPVLNPRTDAPYAEFTQIFSESVLAPAEIDCSVERIRSDVPEEDGKLRQLGCLTYRKAALVDTPDFARTAEPWDSWWGMPSWLVSKAVVDAFRDSKLRGWAFRPVLIADSELYSAYLSQWALLHELVTQSAESAFDGGQW